MMSSEAGRDAGGIRSGSGDPRHACMEGSILEPVRPSPRRRVNTLPSSVAHAIRDINRLLNFPEPPGLIMVYGEEGVGKTFALTQLAGCVNTLPAVKGRRRKVIRVRPSMASAGSDLLEACESINDMDSGIRPVVLCDDNIDQAVMMSGECPGSTFIVEKRDSYVSQMYEFDDETMDMFVPVPMSSNATWGELTSEARHMSKRAADALGMRPMPQSSVRMFMESLLKSIYPSRRSIPDVDEDMDLTFGYVADRIGFAYARSLEAPYEGARILAPEARSLADDAFNDLPPDSHDHQMSPAAPMQSEPKTWERGSVRPSGQKQTAISGYKDPLRLPDRLRLDVISQDDAIDTLSSKVLLDAAGMKRPDKPVGAFLFIGPSGVGKTQLAKSLANELLDRPMNLIRIDCSELAERHTESRLFGAPPGYVGFESGGELTGAVREHPQSVILMDEAEKANPHIWDVFLQVFDAARLTDGSGVTTDFSHCVIIMTSNLGSDAPNSAGFGASDDDSHAYSDAVRTYFRPEFINRLDGVCVFKRLGMESYRRIIDMKIGDAEDRIRESYAHDVSIRLDDATVSWLLDKADSTDHGARGLDDVIGDSILLPVAKGILTKDIDIERTGAIIVNTDTSGPTITTMKAGIDGC